MKKLNTRDVGSVPGQEESLEEEMTIVSILIKKIPWTEDPCRLSLLCVCKELDTVE